MCEAEIASKSCSIAKCAAQRYSPRLTDTPSSLIVKLSLISSHVINGVVSCRILRCRQFAFDNDVSPISWSIATDGDDDGNGDAM